MLFSGVLRSYKLETLVKNGLIIRVYPFSTYVKFSEKLTFLTPWYACAYQGVRNVSFSENFAYVLNGWPLKLIQIWNLERKTNLDKSMKSLLSEAAIRRCSSKYVFLKISRYLLENTSVGFSFS